MTLYLVTGGAGFIGSNIVERLALQGKRVRVLDNFTTGKRENLLPWLDRLELLEGDIRDLGAVRQATEGAEYVLHQAALPSVPGSVADPATTHEVNVTGTLNVLIAARDAGVKRVVFASSCAVYGDNDNLPLREEVPPRPLSPYAASKLAGEMYCQAFHSAYGLATVCLRYFNVYGPRQDPNGAYAAVVPKFATQMAVGLSPVIYGDGKQTRDFVYVGDVVRSNLLACENEGVIGSILNVASGERISLLELVDTLNALLGTCLSPRFEPERKGDIRHSVGDGGQLAALFGGGVETVLVEGLGQLVDRLQQV
jgi:UDP-glucose 4-epimerase